MTLKALFQLPAEIRHRVILAGPFQALSEMNLLLGEPLTLEGVQSLKEASASDRVPVLELAGAREFRPSYGRVSSEAGMIAGRGIQWGTAACMQGEASALVTAPASKEALHLAGFHYPGQTEMIAALCGADRHIMILTDGKMRVGMTTTHVALREVSGLLRRNLVCDKIVALHDGLIRWFGLKDPRLAVAALNPHASDGGIFGAEEENVILPAIEDARRSDVQVDGPFPADALFARWRNYDAILVMYHDQGMIPIKLAAFGQAVNLTSGLPFPRTSPDHGTAFDIAGKLIADPGSMMRAIEWAAEFIDRRKTPE